MLINEHWMKLTLNNIQSGNYLVMSLVGLMIFTSCRSSYILTGVEGGKIAITSQLDSNPDPVTTAILAPYKHIKDSVMNNVIGTSEKDLYSYRPESPLSNLAADILRQAGGRYTDKTVDIAITNIGGLRNSLQKGNITVGNVYEVFPFENHLCILTLSGSSVIRLFSQIAGLRGEGISGVRMALAPDLTVRSLTVNGKEVDPQAQYIIATLDYLSEGNDGMTAFLEAVDEECFEEVTIRQIMLDYIEGLDRQGKSVTGSEDGRITIEQ